MKIYKMANDNMVDLGLDDQEDIKVIRPKKKIRQNIELEMPQELKEEIEEKPVDPQVLKSNIEIFYQTYPDLKRSIDKHLFDLSRRVLPSNIIDQKGKILAYLGGNYPPKPAEKSFWATITYRDLINVGLFKFVQDGEGFSSTVPQIDAFI